MSANDHDPIWQVKRGRSGIWKCICGADFTSREAMELHRYEVGLISKAEYEKRTAPREPKPCIRCGEHKTRVNSQICGRCLREKSKENSRLRARVRSLLEEEA